MGVGSWECWIGLTVKMILKGGWGCAVCHLDEWVGGCVRQREWSVQRPGAGGLPDCLGEDWDQRGNGFGAY